MTHTNTRRGFTQQYSLLHLREKVAGGRMRGPLKAFTLIELLVVVLIIGILAAVAVPQYQKAVLKSRLGQELIHLKALDQAQRAYYLANGTFTTKGFDIEMKKSFCGDYVSSINCPMSGNTPFLAWEGSQKNGTVSWQCAAPQNNSMANQLCQDYQKEWGGTLVTTPAAGLNYYKAFR